MKTTRVLLTMLALASVTVAFAGENRWFAGKQRPQVSTPGLKEQATASGPKEMDGCGLHCSKGCSHDKASENKTELIEGPWASGFLP